MFIWRRDGGCTTLKRLATAGGGALRRPVWTADGRRIAASGNRSPYLWDVASGELESARQGTFASSGARGQSFEAALPQEGTPLVATFAAGESRIDLFNACGAPQGSLLAHEAPLCGLAFTRNGILYSWDQAGVILGWNARSRRPVWRFACAEHGDVLHSARFETCYLREGMH
jgi:hypothetical protein